MPKHKCDIGNRVGVFMAQAQEQAEVGAIYR